MTLMRLEKAFRDNDPSGIRNELTDIETSGKVIANKLAKLGAAVNRLDHTAEVLDSTKVRSEKAEIHHRGSRLRRGHNIAAEPADYLPGSLEKRIHDH